jgi:hypothetical protein
MAYPVAPGEPSYSGTYIPEIWSSKLLVKFYEGTVLTSVTNTAYEGEIRNHGDTVKIRDKPTVTIRDYAKGQNLQVEQPIPTVTELLIDKGKYFSFECKHLDKKQADINFVNSWSEDASEQMKITIERDLFANVYSDVAAANKGLTAGAISGSYNMGVAGTPLLVTKENVIDYLVDARSVLAEQNVPETDCFAIIPVWMANLIKKSDLKDASLSGDPKSTLRTGMIGMIDGMTVYRSNLLDTVSGDSAWHAMVGHISAVTFATQLVENETLKNPFDFGDLHRGLQVYGYKTLKPESLVDLYAAKG